MYFPDNPTDVSPDFLKKIDQDTPGTWIAQPKMDGHRKICAFNGSAWHVSGKKGGTGEHSKIPKEIMAELMEMHFPEGIALDCEWVGPRMKEHAKRDVLYIFDILTYPEPEDRLYYAHRRYLLKLLIGRWYNGANPEKAIAGVPSWQNPGLFDRFQEQMTNPLSEGLVVRRADSRHLMGRNGCLTNPLIFKCKYRNIREKTFDANQ